MRVENEENSRKAREISDFEVVGHVESLRVSLCTSLENSECVRIPHRNSQAPRPGRVENEPKSSEISSFALE